MERLSHHDHHQETYSKTIFGFWIYLLTDFVLFGTLFATYLVLRHGTYGGPSAAELMSLPSTLAQTLIFLASATTCGLASVAAHHGRKSCTIIRLIITFLLGSLFIGMEFHDWSCFLQAGHGWEKSAFLSAYFTLAGTHAVHVLFGLLWMIVIGIPIFYSGITATTLRRIACLRMFWQFLNIIWVFIFAIVVLLGGM